MDQSRKTGLHTWSCLPGDSAPAKGAPALTILVRRQSFEYGKSAPTKMFQFLRYRAPTQKAVISAPAAAPLAFP
jgi:hypothetical protein